MEREEYLEKVAADAFADELTTALEGTGIDKEAALTAAERKGIKKKFKSESKQVGKLKGRGMKNLSGLAGYSVGGNLGAIAGGLLTRSRAGMSLGSIAGAIGGAKGAANLYRKKSKSDYAVASRDIKSRRSKALKDALNS